MFKGSTGGGLDLVWRGDSQYPNGATAKDSDNNILSFPLANSQLYNLQLVLFVMFTLACNVLLLNILIALMSSVYNDVNKKAASQYRFDKALLMIGLERLFIGQQAGQAKRWLHVVAPKESEFWNNDRGEFDGMRDYVDVKFAALSKQTTAEIAELSKQNAENAKLLGQKLTILDKNMKSLAHQNAEIKQFLSKKFPNGF